MNKNRKGCLSEKIAICYLMKKGLDVFDSCQTNGAVDLLTFDPKTGESKSSNFSGLKCMTEVDYNDIIVYSGTAKPNPVWVHFVKEEVNA